jgi:hypothetical protein
MRVLPDISWVLACAEAASSPLNAPEPARFALSERCRTSYPSD